MSLNIKDLKYLLALSEHQHFAKAAEACFISQPALSIQLKKIEAFLGIQLFERTNKRVRVTLAGKKIIEHANQVLMSFNAMKNAAKLAQNPFENPLSLLEVIIANEAIAKLR